MHMVSSTTAIPSIVNALDGRWLTGGEPTGEAVRWSRPVEPVLGGI
jgi:hypothetical protein